MTSREQILSKIKTHQPELTSLPAPLTTVPGTVNLIELFSSVLVSIGGAVVEADSYEEIKNYIKQTFKDQKRIISTLKELADVSEQGWESQDPHSYENVDLAIIQAHFGVAENAALWITEELMHQRAVPFIAQQLAVVVKRSSILATMHDAYIRIGNAEYGFGTFIAGPSKTADIEQSLVLGAHGPKGMTIFLLP
ncbi:LutC/YkgG family protein [Pedobacter metabolipauper]|uniref:L-lactate dehydrogenase complex protein LldG n=1 Tax=Pedobacter metabolipauper TaxID=425513 RepID=A0A4R6SWS4_9SPHI|nr:LUD domain-containing protein [Pedobacter metabolipauper]TDQ10944.1 L-lactate dehydrogenase complex protein LldG [Pedobacter metabolipauper]